MLIATVAVGLVAILAGMTGTWSPCGLSSVQTLGTGLSDSAFGARNVVASVTFTIASLIGGLLTFGLTGWIGSLLGLNGSAPLGMVAAVLALVCGLADLRMLRIVPQIRHQVPEAIRWRLPLSVTGSLYGLLLGLGFTTYILTYALWALVASVLLLGSLQLGVIVGLAFGLGRALPVLYLVSTYVRPTTQRFIQDMEHRPLLLVGMRRLTGIALVLAAVATVPVAIASAQNAPISAAWNPVTSAGVLVYEHAGGSVLVRADGTTAPLPGRFATVDGANVAWWVNGVVTIADAATLTPQVQLPLPGVTALALTGGLLVYRGVDTTSHPIVAEVAYASGGTPGITTLYTAGVRDVISRPSASAGSVVFSVAGPRGSRILRVALVSPVVTTLRTAPLGRLFQNPSFAGDELIYTRIDRCNQALVVGRVSDVHGDHAIAWFAGLSVRDPGWQRHYMHHFNKASKCPTRVVRGERGLLWGTAIGPLGYYVGVLASTTPDTRTILTILK